MRRVVLVGATGVFGSRLAERLAGWPELELVLVARRIEPLEALCARLVEANATAAITVARADRTRPAEIVSLAPWAVIDAAGPFEKPDFDLARAVIGAGGHWIDLADSRAFVAAFGPTLDELACAAHSRPSFRARWNLPVQGGGGASVAWRAPRLRRAPEREFSVRFGPGAAC